MRRSTLLLALSVAGCAPTETGNPEFAAQMALTADTSDPAAVSIGPGGTDVAIDAAWVVVGDVRFVRASVCDAPGEVEIDVVGPGAIDLAEGPLVIPFDLAVDDYCRVRVPLERAAAPIPAGAPPELDDRSIVLTGTRGDGVPFVIASRLNVETDVRSRGAPFALDEARRSVVLAFDVATWLGGVSLTTATVGAGGTIRVDDDDNRTHLDAFEEAVETALRLFRDTDDDGELDPEDRAELLAEGGV